LFTVLVTELRAPAAAGLTACELEELLAGRGREVLRQQLQDHLDLRAAREEQSAREHPHHRSGADGIPRPRLETGHGRELRRLDPDLVALQEVIRTPERDQLGELLAGTNLQATHQAARLCCRPA
jgi:hypothetical protein